MTYTDKGLIYILHPIPLYRGAKNMKTEYITDKDKITELMELIMEVKQNDNKRFEKSYKTTRIDCFRINIYFEILPNEYQIYFTLIDNFLLGSTNS